MSEHAVNPQALIAAREAGRRHVQEAHGHEIEQPRRTGDPETRSGWDEPETIEVIINAYLDAAGFKVDEQTRGMYDPVTGRRLVSPWERVNAKEGQDA